MFRGLWDISLDAKGRLSVPAKVRALIEVRSAGALVLTADLDKNLLIYLPDEWAKAEEKLVNLSTTDRRSRAIKQLYLGHACDCELDSTGRILIPPMLRRFAELEKKVMLSGRGNKLELWSVEHWEAQYNVMEDLLGGDFDGGLGELSL